MDPTGKVITFPFTSLLFFQLMIFTLKIPNIYIKEFLLLFQIKVTELGGEDTLVQVFVCWLHTGSA